MHIMNYNIIHDIIYIILTNKSCDVTVPELRQYTSMPCDVIIIYLGLVHVRVDQHTWLENSLILILEANFNRTINQFVRIIYAIKFTKNVGEHDSFKSPGLKVSCRMLSLYRVSQKSFARTCQI